MEFPAELKYSASHEWVKTKESNSVVVGISEYAQEEISDVVYVELPEVGKEFKAGDVICVVESVKAAFDIYSPVSGKVTEINQSVEDDPSIVNSSPYSDGWLYKMENVDEVEINKLMSADTYKEEIEK